MFNNTGWTYVTSSGLSVTAGFGLEGNAQHVCLYLQDPRTDIYKITAWGIGAGFGASPIPISVSGSKMEFSSGGSDLYSIYNEPIGLADLSQLLVIYSGNGIVTIGGMSVSMVLFVRAHLLQLGYLAIPFAGPQVALFQMTKAFCFMGGSELSTPNLGVDGLVNFYKVSSAEKIDPHYYNERLGIMDTLQK